MSEGWRGEDTFPKWRDATIASLPDTVLTDEAELSRYWDNNMLSAPGPLGLAIWFYIAKRLECGVNVGWSTILAQKFVTAYYPITADGSDTSDR